MISDYKIEVPVLLIGFNRPEIIQQSFEQIRKAKPEKLYVAVDGPRNEVIEDVDLINKVKGIVQDIDWQCDLFALVAIPVIIEMPFLLDLWLKELPEFAVVFARLSLVGLFISKFSFEITNAIRAVGIIKQFQIVETLIFLCNLPVSYFLFKAGFKPVSVYVNAILFSFIASIYRLYIGKKITGMSIDNFVREGILPTIVPILTATVVGIGLKFIMDESFIRLILILITSPIIMIISIRYSGLTSYEYDKIKSIARSIVNKKQ